MISLGRRLWVPPALRCVQYSRSGTQRLTFSSSSIIREENFTPWYVEEARKQEPTLKPTTFSRPELPANASEALISIVDYVVEDIGLKDVVLLDLRDPDSESSMFGPSVIVLGTAVSSQHLETGESMLHTWIKHKFGVFAGREGVLTTNFVKLHNRRQKRKQQRQRVASNNGPVQRVGSWVAVDTKLDGIYVHMLTADRRSEVDLENLDSWMAEFEGGHDAEQFQDYVDPPQEFSGTNGKRPYSTLTPGPKYSSLSSTWEELALDNLLKESRDDITESSPEITDFVQLFPEVGTHADWSHRLQFFAVATINSSIFSVARVVAEAEKMQQNGFVLSEADVETVVSAICYHGQSHFANLSRDDETLVSWRELCDVKALLITRLYNSILLPSSRTLLGNSRLLTLMYRTFTCMSRQSTTPAAALRDPESTRLDAFYDLRRLTPLRYIIECTGELKNIQTVGMMLTSLINSGLYSAFWKVAEGAMISSSSREFAEELAELVVCLAVKSGDEPTLKFVVANFLPQKIISQDIRLSPTLVDATEKALNLIDMRETGEFRSVRGVLEKYHTLKLSH